MSLNGYQGQICAIDQEDQVFKANQNILSLIQNTSIFSVDYFQRLGIQAPIGTELRINNKSIKIGMTGIYEINNVEISSLYFVQDSASSVIIDFIVHQRG